MEYFINPIKNHYVDFTGKETRKPFWMYILIYTIISIVLTAIDIFTGLNILSAIFGLALLLPSLAITTRRLHDTSRSGWWQLLWLLPLIGWIILVVFLAQDSK